MFFKINKLLLTLTTAMCLVAGINRLLAQDEHSIPANLINYSQSNNYLLSDPSLSLPSAGAVNEYPYAYVRLETHVEQAPYTNYTLNLKLEVHPIELDGSMVDAPYQVDLSVSNMPNGSHSGYADVVQHIKNHKYGFKVKVLSNTLEMNGTTTANAQVPDNVSMTIGYETKSYLELTDQTVSIYASQVGNDLRITWNNINSAEAYQLEWTWVDRYGDAINVPLNASQIALTRDDFKHNNTRIQTANREYKIPLVYQEGYLVYRVRTVGKFLADLTKTKFGPWSSDQVSGGLYVPKETVSDWPHKFTITTAHEDKLNWQFQASYAEEGKKKEVISYFDGGLRNRQTVTTINTDDHAVVGEVIYDAQGRAAVQVLPVPVNSNELRYYPNFNQNLNGDDYSYTDFDLDHQNQIDIVSAEKEMNPKSGASQYYSPNNDINSPFRGRIPNADNFPFTQVEFTPDNTGRISRKSGVGGTHQLGSTHDVEYYYAVPEQKELNRLFGYSVGNAAHYKKNMVLDPNRQLSITYLDPQGRTIATALAGYSPDNLIGLEDEDDNSGLHGMVKSDLLGKVHTNDTDNEQDNNNLVATGNFGPHYDELFYTAQKVAVLNEDRDFSYKVSHENPFFKYGCVNSDIFPYVYDLDIEVVDKNVEPLITPISQTITMGTTPFELDPFQASVKRGSFGISKTLKVNPETVAAYAEQYVAMLRDPGSDCYVDPAFVGPAPLVVEGCFSTAEECLDGLGTEQEYLANAIAAYTQEELDELTTAELEQLNASFVEQYQLAVALCNTVNASGANSDDPQESMSCSAARSSLLNDMAPNGQYGLNVNNELSIFNENNVLYSTQIGTSGLHNSWRNPKHEEQDATALSTSTVYTDGHYYNSNGSVSYIQVKKIGEDLYSPGVVEAAIPGLQPLTPGDSVFFLVEPQYLLNASDFVSNWEDSWANSLIIYHPEYTYLEYQEAVCGLQNTTFNSDGYDAYLLSIETYADAVAANLLSNGYSIKNQDPYFTSLGIPFETSTLFAAREGIMNEALNSDFDNSGVPLMSNVYQTIVCNSIATCPPLNTVSDVLSAVSTQTVANQNKFWTNYKTNYIGMKQRLQSGFMNIYARTQGDYNGCIGISEAVSLVAPFAGYSSASVINSYVTSISSSVTDLCDYAHQDLYLTKLKRFIPSDYYYNSGATAGDIANDMSESADYAYYVETGICPLARDLQLFLDHHFRYLSQVNTGVDANLPYTGQYLTLSLYEELEGFLPTNYATVNGAVNGNQLTFSWGAGNIVLDLAIDQWSNYGTTWDIVEVSQIFSSYNEVTNTFEFSVLAHVDRQGVMEDMILTGTTTARIAACSIDDPSTVGEYLEDGGSHNEESDCNRRTLYEKALVVLLNSLQQDGTLNSTSPIDISNEIAFTSSFLSEFYENADQVKWKRTSSGKYELEVDGALGLVMEFNTALPTGVTFTASDFDLVFNADETIVTGQKVQIAWLDNTMNIQSMLGNAYENQDRILNFLCCGDINDYFGVIPNPSM